MRKLAFIAAILCCTSSSVQPKQITATCSWGEPLSGRIDPFACYIRILFKYTPNDTLSFNSEIDASEIKEVNFWLPTASRYQWDIAFIPKEIFEKFSQLKSFTLPGRVGTISHDDFAQASNLIRLAFGNQLKVIPGNVFDRLTKLEILDLSWNKITSIHENGFKGLSNLRTLKLNRNQLQRFKLHTFENVPLLEELLLNNNHIETIEDGVLKLPNLKRLDLSHNKLTELSNLMFKDCMQLEYLDLRSNHITSLRRSVYSLGNLQYLNLDNNRIADIYLRALVRLPALEHLSMENNGPSLNDNIFVSESMSGSSKSVIKNLLLSGNDLKNREILVRLWSFGLTQLEKLHLDNNAFEYIDFYPIYAFPKLKEINLGKNYWKCEWLGQTLEKLETDGIKVNLFSSRFPSSTSFKHINFIPCI
ncbi:leucine-rich repeat-containing protein 15-like [Sitodiplosis mosellana]|uniref:leucine-rich repeat-containing protein 15-like n=1 Tax=Sitodiplosis mosellana TaxID=263140 RepID=UPI002443B40D|nr:leucine-rich repeat-containing protein 15-like [Sitodiplosis mosellana]